MYISKRAVRSLRAAVILLFVVVAVSGCVACVKFDGVPATTEWGAPAGHIDGDVVHSENDIQVSVHEFVWPNDSHLGSTRLAPSFTGTGGQAINTRNINLSFDFSALRFTPDNVKLIFRDTGGFENFSVNGSPIVRGELASGSGGGVSWTVTAAAEANPANRVGTLTINGNVQSLMIGGQEFWIDEVCAKK